MSKLVMGYWDCPYCRTKGIEGISQECPNCGATREKGTKFYMKQGQKTYLTEEQSKHKGKGADWVCPYCHALNSITSDKCKDCGGNRYESEENYFGKTENEINDSDTSYTDDTPDEDITKTTPSETINKPDESQTTKVEITPTEKSKPIDIITKIFSIIFDFIFSEAGLIMFGSAVAIMLVIFIGTAIYNSTHKTFTPNEFLWETKIAIEHYETCHEEDWNIPAGGRETGHENRIHHYNHVVDHYRTVTHSRQVIDGYDISYSYSNNGDGTFTEHEHKTPRYRTEYYDEQEPVYRDDPVYRTYYFYDIDKWVFKYYETKSGTGKTIEWQDYTLEDDTWRDGAKSIEYKVKGTVDGELKLYQCSETIFKQLELGGEFKIVTNLSDNTITQIQE